MENKTEPWNMVEDRTSVEPRHFLGRHTALGQLAIKPKVWRRIPYLRENEGRAPPIVLAVGDRRRVRAIARKLRNPILLPETVAKLSNRGVRARDLSLAAESGRVAMAIGNYGSVPILIVETQMGAPAVQIIMNEILSDELTANEYKIGHEKFELKHKIVLRIGTAGGINCEGAEPINVGDVVNATHSLGATGAIIQSLSGLDFWRPETLQAFRGEWLRLGPDFTYTTGGHPKVECSGEVIDAIDMAAHRLPRQAYHKGGNVTKDSLYAELSDEAFLNLCRTENCRTTEMELSAIAASSREHNASFGMISAIVGTLPGSSFAEDEKLKGLAERRAIQVALESVKRLV